MNVNKLESIKAKFEELTKQISDPEVIADNKEWTKLVKEHSTIQPVVDAYLRYTATQKEIAEEIRTSTHKSSFNATRTPTSTKAEIAPTIANLITCSVNS